VTEENYPEINTGKGKNEFICNNTVNYYDGRKVVIWGNYAPSKAVSAKLREQYAIDTAFYVDIDPAKANGTDCFLPEVLSGRADEYYVVVPLKFHDTVTTSLNEYGYVRNKDYYYYDDCIISHEEEYYEDTRGNRIIGNTAGVNVVFNGCNSLVQIGKNVKANKTKMFLGNSAVVEIGDSCNLNEVTFKAADSTRCSVGENTRFVNAIIDLLVNASFKCGTGCKISCPYMLRKNNVSIWNNVQCVIGNNCGFGYGVNIALTGGSLSIGDNCVFAHDVEFRSSDSHSIFDIISGENINSTPEIMSTRKIEIGNHVWVGAKAFILYNTVIRDGSIIGAQSLVKGYVPNNSIAAGNPARVIRKNVAWCRKDKADNILDCGEEYINLTDAD
jgi:acetyltransferase-like isoleucine patch superfamily enzyme